MVAEPKLNTDAPRVIPVAKPYIPVAAHAAVARCLSEGRTSGGRYVEEFEEKFAAFHGAAYGVACNSGTTALQLALRASGVGIGSLVAMPTMTMVACANAAIHCGAEPVLCDSEPVSGLADPELWRRCTDFADVSMPVSLYGRPCTLLVRDDKPTVSDNCEAHGTMLRGRAAVFSLYANKIVQTGEGGIVITNDEEMAARMRSLRAHAFSPDEHFKHTELAYGFRMTAMQAALGTSQVHELSSILARRSLLAKEYTTMLYDLEWLELCPGDRRWWVYPLLVKAGSPVSRDELRAFLAERGVETRTWFRPLHLQPHVSGNRGEYFGDSLTTFPVAEDLWRRGLYLPLWIGLGEEGVDYVCQAVRDAFKR